MKTNCWLLLVTLIATSAVAQTNSSRLPEIPLPAGATPAAAPAPTVVAPTNAPAAAPKKAAPKKKVVKKIVEPTSSLVPGPATVTSDNLNLRGQAGLKGEVVAHAKKGDTLTVLSQINLDKHAADEPAQWAKVALPASTKVWASSRYIDATNKVVNTRKLNLRAGPGENFSVLGVMTKGEPVSIITTKGGWTQIEPPANSGAYVAAMYLKQETPVVAANNPPPVIPEPAPTPAPPVVVPAPVPTPAPAPTTVTEPAPLVRTPSTPEPTPSGTEPAAAAPAKLEATDATAVVDTNAPPRVVSHEGYVRSSVSPVAPTYYELFDWDTGNAINYLYSPTTNLDLGRYNGSKVIVTGQEGMVARWPSTPVLTIQKIYVVETHYPSDYKRVSSPRGSDQQIIRARQPQQRR